MKSEINNCCKGTSYPCLKQCIHHEFIVLFQSEKEGTVVYTDENLYELGAYIRSWIPEHFKPFNGTINLSNV